MKVVSHIPHASLTIPEDVRGQFVLSDEELWAELKLIDICFRPDVSLRERAKVLIDVFNYIAELPASCGRDGLVWEKAPLKQLDHISVKQIGWDGIHWEAGSPASWIDPESALQERLADKMCNKIYESDHPIELIVYLDRQISPPENTDWENRLATVAAEHLASSPFRAVWLMNGWSDSVHRLA